MKRKWITKFLVVLMLGGAFFFSACANKEQFTQTGTTEYFVQEFNPPTLDVLWVMDNRSPMYDGRGQVLPYVSKFFERLDAESRDYKMAVTTADMQFARGALRPLNSPIILQRNIGTPGERLNLFSSLIGSVINLRTGAAGEGLAAAVSALSNHFVPRANVPLVVIFVSYTDDVSTFTGSSAFEDYRARLLALKGGNADLLRVYAVNYFPLEKNIDSAVLTQFGLQGLLTGIPNPVTSASYDKYRCLQFQNNGIDRDNFEYRYFRMAKSFGGDVGNICASDLDSGFATSIDLSGLRLKQLPNRFKLGKTSRPGTFTVSVFHGDSSFDIPWQFDAATNEIVFSSVPPEGTTIQVTYVSN